MNFWIARDKDGTLAFFTEKPEKIDDIFIAPTEDTHVIFLEENRYPEVTFENSPQQVELKLCDNNDSTLVRVKEKLSEMKSLHPEFAKIIEEDFWDLLC